MFFVSPTPEYPRKTIEYVFKIIYQLTTCFHIISFVIIVTDFYTRLAESLPGYLSHSDLKAHPSISMVMEGCTYRGVLKAGLAEGIAEVSLDGVTIGLVIMAKHVTFICFLELLQIINCVVSSSNYTSYRRHLRVFGAHVPFYHILVVFTFIYSFSIIIFVYLCDRERTFYRNAISYCANEVRKKDPTRLLIAEYDEYNIMTTVIYWPFAACCVNLLVSFTAVYILFRSSLDKATLLHSQADAPWESHTPFCTTQKSVLRLHTAQRNAILNDARTVMREGLKVRIVRTYQLMSDSDFEALVQAMRDQVARGLKEKQFENLQEHFGDNESQIENTGLLWRQNANWVPQMSSDNVEQANYFDAFEYSPDDGNADHSNELLPKGFEGYNSRNRSHVRHVHSSDSLFPSEDYRMHLNPYERAKNRHHDTGIVAVDTNDSVGGPSELAHPYMRDEHLSNLPLPLGHSTHSHNLSSHHYNTASANEVMEGDFRDEPAARIPSHHDVTVPTTGIAHGNTLRNRSSDMIPPLFGANLTDGVSRQGRLKGKPTKQATIEDEIIPADELSDTSETLFRKK
ncbi:unnamed protein product [Phytomonas sp. Hart1]|nr:unnamed protein product [Phytomonas sp. Hart1]|eukprot:CCW66890.1 unnamed protein product [Phytomonas sp. isolate Hart1]